MLKNDQTHLIKSWDVHSARFLKYVGPFSSLCMKGFILLFFDNSYRHSFKKKFLDDRLSKSEVIPKK